MGSFVNYQYCIKYDFDWLLISLLRQFTIEKRKMAGKIFLAEMRVL